MAYEGWDFLLVSPTGNGADVVPSLNRQDRALADALVLGTSPIVGATYQTFNSDGVTTPATDGAIPAIEIITAPGGVHKWKVVTSYDATHENRVVTATSYRSYDSGTTWVQIDTETPTYDSAGNIVG